MGIKINGAVKNTSALNQIIEHLESLPADEVFITNTLIDGAPFCRSSLQHFAQHPEIQKRRVRIPMNGSAGHVYGSAKAIRQLTKELNR